MVCGVLLFLCSFPIGANAQEAQTMSLEHAIEMAVQNNPRLRIAATDVKRIRAARGEVVELASTEFSYSWGQLNGTERKDKETAVTQPIGSILAPFYKNALVNKQVATGNYYKQMVEKK